MKYPWLFSLGLLAGAALATPTVAADDIDRELATLRGSLDVSNLPKDYGDWSALEKARFWEKRAQERTAIGVDLLEKHPGDPRRWSAALILIDSSPPYFAQDFVDLAGETPRPGEIVRPYGTQTFRLVNHDRAAYDAFLRRREELKEAVLAASDLLPADRERVVSRYVLQPALDAAAKALSDGQPVDWAALRAQVDAFVKEYPGSASGYLAHRYARTKAGGNEELFKAEWISFENSVSAEEREKMQRSLALAAAEAQAEQELKATPLEVAFTAVDGREVDLKRLRGKVVLVEFWATWCGPCMAEMPNIKKVYAAYHDQGFEIIGISCDVAPAAGDTPQKARMAKSAAQLIEFKEKNGMPWPDYYDGRKHNEGGNLLAQRFGITGIPASFLLDKTGHVVALNLRGEKLEVEVKRLLGL